jgi:integrase
MSEKRKDKKGRVLKDGESQRTDGSYQFRYTDIRGKRKYVYARTLQELRDKEKEIQHAVSNGLNYCSGELTMLELVKKYLAQKAGMRYNTRLSYDFVLGILEDEDFAARQIKTIKKSDAKEWFLKLKSDGRRYSTIQSVRGVVRPAFDMAVDEDILKKNPFAFTLTDVIPDDTIERVPLTEEEERRFLEYLRESPVRERYYDPVIILLGTGMRISEMCGLTIFDLDFAKRRIHVERQLVRTKHCEYYLEKPKTESGERYIPMSNEVYDALKRVLRDRVKPKVEIVVDGKSGFLFLDKDEKPKVAGHFEHALKRIVDNYNASHPDQLAVTPHILRHTFCTKLARAGMPVKELQYLMGHSDVGTTLKIYTHLDYDAAAKSFEKYSSTAVI